MIDQDQLASFLDHSLDPRARASVETALESDPESLRYVLEQQKIDRALRSLLGNGTRRQQLKQSILVVVSGPPIQELQAQVLADTSGSPGLARATTRPGRGWLHRVRTYLSTLRASFHSQALAWSAGACVVAFLVAGAWLVFRPAPAATVMIGQFASVVGAPTLKHEAQQPALNPQPHTQIYLGDHIETGDADKGELVFEDGTTLRLGYNTVIEIPKLKAAQRNATSSLRRPAEINLLRGQIWTKVQKLPNAPRYAIHTQAATAVARGTEFGVKIQRSASTALAGPTTVLTVKEGAVDFSNSMGSVQATAMTESTATAGTAPTEPARLNTLKSVDLGPGKALVVGGLSSLLAWPYRLSYPQGWAGLELASITASPDDRAPQLRIVRVWPGSPAERAGVAVGDVITHVNGGSVTNVQEVRRAIAEKAGASISVAVDRNGLSKTAVLVTSLHPYALPFTDIPTNLTADIFKSTWPIVEVSGMQSLTLEVWRAYLRECEELAERYPEVAAAQNNLGLWHEANDQFGPAIQHYGAAVAAAPDTPLYHYDLGRALGYIGNFERYAEEMEQVLKLSPGWIPGVIALAEAYNFLNRQNEALQVLESGIEQNRTSSDLWAAKAILLLSSRNYDLALAAALRATELEPSYAERYMYLSIVQWSRGDHEASLEASRKAVELDPGLADANVNLAIDLVGQLGSRLPGAPTDAPAEELAIEHWQNRPADELAILDEAEGLCRRAIALNPDSAVAYVNLGKILLTRGAVDEAEKSLRKVIEIDSAAQGWDAYNSLAYFFALWGIRLNDALAFAQNAVQLAPSGATFDTLAMVHFRRGEWEQAESAWRKCIEVAGESGDAGAWFHLGKLYERTGRPSAALAAYQQALRLQPDYPEAVRALATLRK